MRICEKCPAQERGWLCDHDPVGAAGACAWIREDPTSMRSVLLQMHGYSKAAIALKRRREQEAAIVDLAEKIKSRRIAE